MGTENEMLECIFSKMLLYIWAQTAELEWRILSTCSVHKQTLGSWGGGQAVVQDASAGAEKQHCGTQEAWRDTGTGSSFQKSQGQLLGSPCERWVKLTIVPARFIPPLLHRYLVPFCLASASHSSHDAPVSEFSMFWILHEPLGKQHF